MHAGVATQTPVANLIAALCPGRLCRAVLQQPQQPMGRMLGSGPRPRRLQQVRVHRLLHRADAGLLPEVVRAQQAEVVVRVAVVERQDEVDERLAAAPPRSAVDVSAGSRARHSLAAGCGRPRPGRARRRACCACVTSAVCRLVESSHPWGRARGLRRGMRTLQVTHGWKCLGGTKQKKGGRAAWSAGSAATRHGAALTTPSA